MLLVIFPSSIANVLYSLLHIHFPMCLCILAPYVRKNLFNAFDALPAPLYLGGIPPLYKTTSGFSFSFCSYEKILLLYSSGSVTISSAHPKKRISFQGVYSWSAYIFLICSEGRMNLPSFRWKHSHICSHSLQYILYCRELILCCFSSFSGYFSSASLFPYLFFENPYFDADIRNIIIQNKLLRNQKSFLQKLWFL